MGKPFFLFCGAFLLTKVAELLPQRATGDAHASVFLIQPRGHNCSRGKNSSLICESPGISQLHPNELSLPITFEKFGEVAPANSGGYQEGSDEGKKGNSFKLLTSAKPQTFTTVTNGRKHPPNGL